jgi:biotin carboxyl carrier protein
MRLIARRGDEQLDVEVTRHGTGYRVRIGDRWMEADFVSVGRFVRSLRLDDGTQFSLIHHREGTMHEISIGGSIATIEIIDPLAARRKRTEDAAGTGGLLRALMPGRVVRLLVEPGEEVRKGAGILVLEAMKMENEIQAPADGIVDQIFVSAGQTVESGADLVHITSA